MTIGHFQTIYESEDFLCVECFVKRNYAEIDGSEPDYAARITAVHYESGKKNYSNYDRKRYQRSIL